MNRMLVDSLGDVTIKNDGATTLKEIVVQHLAAKKWWKLSNLYIMKLGEDMVVAWPQRHVKHGYVE